MANQQELKQTVIQARKDVKKRNFSQSFELIVSFKDLDLKKQPLNLNEIVRLPNNFGKIPKICVFASGDLALRAEKVGVDDLFSEDELNVLSSQKRDVKKLSRKHDFFLAESKFMVNIGKLLGSQLGPLGKMPTPLPPNAPIEDFIKRFRSSVRIKCKNVNVIACKIGDESMTDDQVIENTSTILDFIEGKLPLGSKNLKDIFIKLSMSNVTHLKEEKKK